jgi:hypothetical protein
LLAIFSGIEGAVNVTRFSPDEQRILAAGANGEVREWRIWQDLASMVAEATGRAGQTNH